MMQNKEIPIDSSSKDISDERTPFIYIAAKNQTNTIIESVCSTNNIEDFIENQITTKDEIDSQNSRVNAQFEEYQERIQSLTAERDNLIKQLREKNELFE